jgi:Skp family chaperone for outer membrane proteins
MKRSMAWMAAALALVAAVYFGSTLGAKPAPQQAPVQTRVAVLNLRLVIKNYEGYKLFFAAMKKKETGYIEALKGKQTEIENLLKQAENLQGEARKANELQVRSIQREIEDTKTKVRTEVQKESRDEMVRIYKLVRDAASQYALANNFQLVFHYEGPSDETETDSPVLVMKHINAGGCVPFYFDPTLDISAHIIKALNAEHKRGGK